MKHNTEFIQNFMKYYDYPQEAVDLFTKVLKQLDEDRSFGKKFDKQIDRYLSHETMLKGKILNRLTLLGFPKGYKSYTMHFVFLLCLTENLKKKYDLLGIDEKVYYETMRDLKCKLLECMECRGVPGTFVAWWIDGFFRLERVAYGRFQYEVSTYGGKEAYKLKCGKVLNPGDIFVGFHIPSSGVSLSDEIRMASYKEAYENVKHLFPDGIVIFGCGSWLLYPKHREFIPERLNIRRFMDDFEIVEWNENDDFHDCWRIFGKDAKLPYDKLPKDTSLKKAYAEWLASGHKTGGAFGVIAFDGEKILK